MAFGQGLAQFASAFLGSMGGAGSLDQTVINLKSGGQTVLSTFVAGLILFVIAAGAYPAVNIVPLSAVVGVMFYLVRSTCIEIEPSMLRIANLFAIMNFQTFFYVLTIGCFLVVFFLWKVEHHQREENKLLSLDGQLQHMPVQQ